MRLELKWTVRSWFIQTTILLDFTWTQLVITVCLCITYICIVYKKAYLLRLVNTPLAITWSNFAWVFSSANSQYLSWFKSGQSLDAISYDVGVILSRIKKQEVVPSPLSKTGYGHSKINGSFPTDTKCAYLQIQANTITEWNIKLHVKTNTIFVLYIII